MCLGNSKHLGLLVVFLAIASAVLGQPGKSYKYRFTGNGPQIASGGNSIAINYSLSELDIEEISAGGGYYYRIRIPGHTPSPQPGKPEFPVLSRTIVVPDGSAWRIRITNVESRRVTPSRQGFRGLLFPAQAGQTKEQQPGRSEFVIDKKLYATKGLIKSDTVRIEYSGKIREKQLANLIISPVRYDPQRNIIEIITSMNIEISFLNSVSSSKSALKESVLFSHTLEKGVLNYDPEDVITGFSDQPVGMIILTDTAFRKHLEPFFKWKRQKGFNLNIIYRGEEYGGNTFTEIKETIAGIYANSSTGGIPPDYLLIIGDATRIPTYGTGYLTDMYYGEFDGNGDYIPDMFIGRVPATDTTAVKTFVKKIIQYEKFEFADTNKFYDKALVFAGRDASYAPYMNGQVKYAVSNYLNPGNRINGFHFYYPEGATRKDSIMNLISNGVSFVNYSGHGTAAGWLHVEIKSPDVARLTNANMYPFVISNACRTAQFDDTASFGNKMLLASDRGAVGFIGCSNDSYWDEDFYWAVGTGTPSSDPKYSTTGLGAYDRMFHTNGEQPSDWFITMGQVNFAGNLSVSSSPSLRKKYYWETYTLLGDPSAIPLTGTPLPFNSVLPGTLPPAIRSLSLTLEPFSYIAISDFETLWDASFASPSGSVVLDLPAIKGDSCLVVITGQNRIPLIKTIHFSEIGEEFINLSRTEINDAGANNNGKADFGENFFLRLRIGNLGKTDATGLTASISSDSEWVTINSSSVNIGTIEAGSEVIIDNDLELTIDQDVPDLGIVTVDLILKDTKSQKNYRIDIPLHAPLLEIINFIIDDSETGNSNLVADPGETFDMIFQVRNDGSSNTSGQLDIITEEEELEIINPNVKSGILQFGKVTNIPVTVKLSESAVFGSFVPIRSLLDCSPYFVERNFIFRIGRIRESFESASFSVFPWINADSKPWKITGSSAQDGNFAARSGVIGHNGSSTLALRANYTRTDSVRFWYKVSSENNYDYFQFKLNDVEMVRASGEKGWEKRSFEVPAGLNKMEWIYKKDNSVSQGADCATIDLIDFAVSSPVDYIRNDLAIARIGAPVQKEIYGQEPVTVTVKNLGADTINKFNLAYVINSRTPVFESFEEVLAPFGDSAIVTFERRADLDLNGIYNITVFGSDNPDDFLLNDTLMITLENTEIEESVKLFPSPFTDELTVIVNSRSAGKIRINLADLSGRQRFSREEEIIEGENYIVLNTTTLSPSFYILYITGKNYSKAFRIIKTRN